MLRLTMGAAVRVTGRLVFSPSAGQSHEIVVDTKNKGDVVVLGDCDTEVLIFPSQEYDPFIFSNRPTPSRKRTTLQNFYATKYILGRVHHISPQC